MGRYNILNGQLLYPTIQTLYMTICLPLNWFSVTPATRYLSLTWRQPCEYGKHSSHSLIQLTPVCRLKGESGILISDPIVLYHNEEENKIGLDCPEVFKRLQENAAG